MFCHHHMTTLTSLHVQWTTSFSCCSCCLPSPLTLSPLVCHAMSCMLFSHIACTLQSVGFRSWSRFFAISLQVVWVINPAVGCHYFSPGLQLPHNPWEGCYQFCCLVNRGTVGMKSLPKTYPTASRLRFEPGPFCAWVQHSNHSATEPHMVVGQSVCHSVCLLDTTLMPVSSAEMDKLIELPFAVWTQVGTRNQVHWP